MKILMLAVLLAVLTMVFPRWLELTTGLDPDAGSGAVEVLIVFGCLLVAVARGWLLWRRRSGVKTNGLTGGRYG